MQFWRESIHMVLETLIGGTQGEEAQKIYKEEDSRLLRLSYVYMFMS